MLQRERAQSSRVTDRPETIYTVTCFTAMTPEDTQPLENTEDRWHPILNLRSSQTGPYSSRLACPAAEDTGCGFSTSLLFRSAQNSAKCRADRKNRVAGLSMDATGQSSRTQTGGLVGGCPQDWGYSVPLSI